MQLKSTSLLIGAALFALPALTQAQPLTRPPAAPTHYVPGVEGIKAASLPPPGWYLRDYNVLYYSTTLNDATGHELTGHDTRALVYANVPRIIWITPLSFLAATSALMPSFPSNTPRSGSILSSTIATSGLAMSLRRQRGPRI